MAELRITVRPAEAADFDGVEELLERLDLPDEALANLCSLAKVDEAALVDQGGEWSARVEVDGSVLWLRARDGRWTIYGDDEAMAAARRLHGLIGASGEGWDLDR